MSITVKRTAGQSLERERRIVRIISYGENLGSVTLMLIQKLEEELGERAERQTSGIDMRSWFCTRKRR